MKYIDAKGENNKRYRCSAHVERRELVQICKQNTEFSRALQVGISVKWI